MMTRREFLAVLAAVPFFPLALRSPAPEPDGFLLDGDDSYSVPLSEITEGAWDTHFPLPYRHEYSGLWGPWSENSPIYHCMDDAWKEPVGQFSFYVIRRFDTDWFAFARGTKPTLLKAPTDVYVWLTGNNSARVLYNWDVNNPNITGFIQVTDERREVTYVQMWDDKELTLSVSTDVWFNNFREPLGAPVL